MSLDVRDFRNALGRFATGVTLVTAVSDTQKALGMTCLLYTSDAADE